MTRRKSAILAIALSLGLVLGACGDDTTPTAGDDDSGQGSEEGGAFTVTVTGENMEAPDEVAGGIVEVTFESDAPEGEAELSLTKVPAGTSEDDFRQAIASATSGGSIPPVIEATAGVAPGTHTVELPEGGYFVWTDKPEPEGEDEGEEGPPEGGEPEGEGEEGGPPPADPSAFIVRPLTVTAGQAGDLPDTGSTVTARDYTFDIDVEAGRERFTFRNEGPDQLHHAVFLDFGDIPSDDVEENLPAFIESEGQGEDLPAAFKELNPEEVFGPHSGVFSPGLGGTAEASFESGNTYAAVCFIQDRDGGAPHVIEHGMQVVFEVE